MKDTDIATFGFQSSDVMKMLKIPFEKKNYFLNLLSINNL